MLTIVTWGNVLGTKGLHPAAGHSSLSQPRDRERTGIPAPAQVLECGTGPHVL